jgi:hypothetical protein
VRRAQLIRTSASALALTCATLGCSSSHSGAHDPTSSSLPPVHGCAFLSTGDVERITHDDALQRIDLAPQAQSGVECGTTFSKGGGDLVLTVQRFDASVTLAKLRAAHQAQHGAAIRPAAGLGSGAFSDSTSFVAVAGADGRVITLAAEFANGAIEVTQQELLELARRARAATG